MSKDFVRRIQVGDARAQLLRFPEAFADMVVTSPPYANGLRDYGVEGQLGVEPTVDAWAENVLDTLEPLERVLKPAGTLWLNVGDGYARKRAQGAPAKSLLLGPERLALKLIERGWILRNKIVWAKPNGMPSNVGDRLRHQWEHVFVFARARHYFFDLDAVRVPHTSRPPKRRERTHPASRRRDRWQGTYGDRGNGLARNRALGRVGHELGKNPGDVWTIPTSAWRGDHHATFPVALAERCISAGCPEKVCTNCGAAWRRKVERRLGAVAVRGVLRQQCDCAKHATHAGIVLDPFLGSGTTAVAAEKLNRDWAGIELNPDYAALAMERITASRRASDDGRRRPE